jgi:hypothetical protein
MRTPYVVVCGVMRLILLILLYMCPAASRLLLSTRTTLPIQTRMHAPPYNFKLLLLTHTTHTFFVTGSWQAVQGGRAGADVKLGAGGHGAHASGCAPRGACRERKKIRIPHGLPPGLVNCSCCSCCGGVAWLSFSSSFVCIY